MMLRNEQMRLSVGYRFKNLMKYFHCLLNILLMTHKNYYIIIDQLDDNWAENDTRYKFIRALIEEIKVFRKIKNIKIIAALRLDLLRSVFNITRGSGFQEEKYESYILDIKWTSQQLTELVQKRVREVYKRQYTREDVTIKDIFPKAKGAFRHHPY